LNLSGTLVLFFSFQATSSSFRLIRRPISDVGVLRGEYDYEICVQDFTLLSTDKRGIMLGHQGCPTAEDDRPAAVVNTEHPNLITAGFLMTFAGFIIQFFAVPEQQSIAQLRQEIKRLQIREKARSPVDRK
jgi:hypothetical protein